MDGKTREGGLHNPLREHIIEKTPTPRREPWRWLEHHQPKPRSTMSCTTFCAIPRSPASPSPLLVNDPPFWVAAAVACRFAGLPATYTVERFEDLAELVADPVGFAADLAGLSRAEYLRRLAGEVV